MFSDASIYTSETMSQTINRLAEQAAPLMTSSLRAYGNAHASLRPQAADSSTFSSKSARELKALITELGGSPAGCLDKSDLVDKLLESAGGAKQCSAFFVAADEQQEGGDDESDESKKSGWLRCVCQGRLLRTSGRERCKQLFQAQREFSQLTAQQLEQVVDLQLASGHSIVICDLCDTQLRPSDAVYTCDNGGRTILHPTTYDVCVTCFVRYAIDGLGDDGLATVRREMSDESVPVT